MFIADEKLENQQFHQPLSEDELTAYRQKFSTDSIKLRDEQSTFKEEVKIQKSIFSARQKELNEMMNVIKSKKILKTGTLTIYKNHETGEMMIKDDQNNIIEQRKMLPEERQLSLTYQIKSGTDGY